MSWTINFIMMHVSVLDPLLLACASKQNGILINFSVCKLNIDTKNQERLEACSSLMFTKKEREKKNFGERLYRDIHLCCQIANVLQRSQQLLNPMHYLHSPVLVVTQVCQIGQKLKSQSTIIACLQRRLLYTLENREQ